MNQTALKADAVVELVVNKARDSFDSQEVDMDMAENCKAVNYMAVD